MSHRDTHRPLCLLSVAKWTVPLFVLLGSPLLLFTLVICQAGNCRASPILCPLLLLHPDRLARGNELVHKIVMTRRIEPLFRNVIFVIF